MNVYLSIIGAASSSVSSTASASVSTIAPGPALPSGLTSLGCYQDSSTTRILAGPWRKDYSMTPVTCATWCASQGYKYMGLEYGVEVSQSPGAVLADDSATVGRLPRPPARRWMLPGVPQPALETRRIRVVGTTSRMCTVSWARLSRRPVQVSLRPLGRASLRAPRRPPLVALLSAAMLPVQALWEPHPSRHREGNSCGLIIWSVM